MATDLTLNIQGFNYSNFNTTKVYKDDQNKDIYAPCAEAGYGPYRSFEEAITAISTMFVKTAETGTTGYLPPLGLKFGVISGGVLDEYMYKSGEFSVSNKNVGIVKTGGGITITDTVPASAEEADSNKALSQVGALALKNMIAAGSGNGIIGVYVDEVSEANSLVGTVPDQQNPGQTISTGTAIIPTASTEKKGLVKLGYTPNTNTPCNYPVQLNSTNSTVYVEVPSYKTVNVVEKKGNSTSIECSAVNTANGNKLTLSAGDNVTLSANNSTRTVTINAAGGVPSDFIEVLEPGLYNVDLNFTAEPVAAKGGTYTLSDTVLKDIQRIKNILGDLWNDDGPDYSFKFEEE